MSQKIRPEQWYADVGNNEVPCVVVSGESHCDFAGAVGFDLASVGSYESDGCCIWLQSFVRIDWINGSRRAGVHQEVVIRDGVFNVKATIDIS